MDARQLAALRDVLAGWIEESRTHGEPFGEPTTDGRARFDVRGRPMRRARLTEATIELPEQPVRASFFAVQEEAGDAAS